MLVHDSFHVNAQAVLDSLKTRMMFSRTDPSGKRQQVEIGDVWIESRPGEDMICATASDGEKFSYSISPATKRKWYTAKKDLTRLSLLAQSSGGQLQLRKETCPKVIGIRVSEQEYGQFEAEARACNRTLSDYCRMQLAGKSPHVALDPDVQCALIDIRQHLVNYANAMKGVYRQVPQSDRPKWIVEGVAWQQYRQYMAQALRYLDQLIDK